MGAGHSVYPESVSGSNLCLSVGILKETICPVGYKHLQGMQLEERVGYFLGNEMRSSDSHRVPKGLY